MIIAYKIRYEMRRKGLIYLFEKLEQIVDSTHDQIVNLKMKIELVPNMDVFSSLPPEQCMIVLSIICVIAALFIGTAFYKGISYFYSLWKRKTV